MNIIEEHYRKNFSILVKKLSGFLGHHSAEDALQNSYMRAIQYCKCEDSFNKYFGGILRNCIKDIQRDNILRGIVDRNLEQHLTIFNTTYHSPEEEMAAKEDVSDIQKKINQRPEAQRDVLQAFFIEQRSYNEILKLIPDTNYPYLRKIVSSFRKELM